MLLVKRFLLYASLVCMTIVLVGGGFHTAELGIQSLVGTGGPPKSIHVNADKQAIRVTVLGKQVVEPKPTLGDRWSRQIESTRSELGETMSEFSFQTGRLLQDVSRRIIEWIGSQLEESVR
ncbi:hypothetical protein [Effusibacillus pohliae]|uniref:hypothetical protein n=1 Tax=Effusibacillus pohliae TaxID=232270 RepID=UPI000360FC5C|nr:hypothetical protein [Effusibacillus pohliae]